MSIIVGFQGKKRSGKNYCSGIIKECLENKGYSVEEYSFASRLKQYCYLLLQADVRSLEELVREDFTLLGITHKAIPPLIKALTSLSELPHLREFEDGKPRKLLQVVGTEVFRDAVSQNYWIHLLRKRIQRSQKDYALITDVRFPNEADICHYNIKVLGGRTGDAHVSEVQELPFNMVLDNSNKDLVLSDIRIEKIVENLEMS